jgi:hypothetical protein
MSTKHGFDALAVAWALDALDPAESALFAEHVRGCERCSGSVADARETAALLAFALVPAPRTPELADRILDTTAGASAPGVTNWRRVAAVAAAASLVIGLGSWNAVLHRDRDASRHDTEQLRGVAGALLADGGTRIDLHGARGLDAVVVVTGSTMRVVSVLLPENDSSRSIYVLWGMRGGATVPLGTFDIGSAELATSAVRRTATGPMGFGDYAVTRESGRHIPAAPSTILAEGAAG